jgi:L-aminopeptidase/D-esterase-like protein
MQAHGLPRGLPIHTALGVVVTDAALTKAQATRLALLAHTGLARTVSPSHTVLDGDTFFVLSKGRVQADWMALQASVPHVVAEAVMRSVRTARSLGGVPGLLA